MSCTCKAVWKKNRIFDGFDKNGRLVNIDASAMYGGDDTAPSPMDFLILGLSGCTGIVFTIAMEHLGVVLQSLEVHGEGCRAEQEPGEYLSMGVFFNVEGDGINHDIIRKAITEFVIPKAPVFCTLGKSCPIRIGYMHDGGTYEYHPDSATFAELKN